MWDLAINEISGKLLLDFLELRKHIAAICHGSVAILKAEELKRGLLKGQNNCFFKYRRKVSFSKK